LRFPLGGSADSDPAVDAAARTTLAALALLGATLAAEAGADLRSRCFLLPTAPLEWELLGNPGDPGQRFILDGKAALALFASALDSAQSAGLPWEGEIPLQPTEELVQLVARSQELAAAQAGDGAA
jgi:CRISPR-associated protein Csb1